MVLLALLSEGAVTRAGVTQSTGARRVASGPLALADFAGPSCWPPCHVRGSRGRRGLGGEKKGGRVSVREDRGARASPADKGANERGVGSSSHSGRALEPVSEPQRADAPCGAGFHPSASLAAPAQVSNDHRFRRERSKRSVSANARVYQTAAGPLSVDRPSGVRAPACMRLLVMFLAFSPFISGRPLCKV